MDAFSLDRFAPPDTLSFKLRRHGDHVFEIDGDPDTDTVARMLRIEETLRVAVDDAEVEKTIAEAKHELLELIRERQPDTDNVRVGAQELMIIFALILHGSSVAAAVVDAITSNGTAAPPAGGNDGDGPANVDGPPSVEAGGAAPLASARRSPGRSSGSDGVDAGLLVTGTA